MAKVKITQQVKDLLQEVRTNPTEENVAQLSVLLQMNNESAVTLITLFRALKDELSYLKKIKKGDKGDPGENAPKPKKEELLNLIKPLIPKPIQGRNGEKPTQKELISLIKPLIPKVENGKDAEPEDVVPLVLKKLKLPEVPNYQPLIESIENRLEELSEKIKRIKKQSDGSAGGTTIFGSVGHSPVHETFTMNGSDTTVTLRKGVAAQGTAIMVRYQGQMLDLTSQYTVNGNKVTFVGFTPEADTIISVTYWG